MSEHKPFEATPSRVQRALREGDAVRSADLSALLAFGAGAAALTGLLPVASGAAAQMIRDAAAAHVRAAPYVLVGGTVVTVAAMSLAGAVLAQVALAGRFSFAFPSVKTERLNPAAGLQRMMSRESALFAAKAAVVAAVCGALLADPVRHALGASISGADAQGLARIVADGTAHLFAALVILGAMASLADVLVQRGSWSKRLRMSFAEFKEDIKQQEGDPVLRSRRRASHRGLIRGSLSSLEKATVVVANPAHVAIALAYRPPAEPVPRVLVRAVDDGARRVKRRAAELGVPIVEDVALARALLARTGAGELIPLELYVPVARIIAALQGAPA